MPVFEGDSGEFPFFPQSPKGNRPPPPGGGPDGGPGGGFTGFAGVRPNVLRGLSGFGTEGLPLVLRKRQRFTPGVTPGPPGRTDTVPAMLSPGEMVMNNGVTQDPEQLAMLLAMNQQGAAQMGAPMGFAHGGMVPGEGVGNGGMMHPRAYHILRMLLELDGFGGHEGEGAQPEGYAYGGIAGFGGPLANRMKPMAGGFGKPGAGPSPGGGFTFQQGGQTQRPPMQQTTLGGSTPAFGGAQPAAPPNPFGNLTPGAKTQDETALGGVYRLINQAGAGGAYDPRGNQQLLGMLLEGAQGDADALVRRQMTQADLSGLDPAQAAVAKQQALRDTGRGVQDIMANTRGQFAANQQQFMQDLLRQAYGADLGYVGNEQNARNERIAQQNANANANRNWWQGIVGAGVGGLAGRR